MMDQNTAETLSEVSNDPVTMLTPREKLVYNMLTSPNDIYRMAETFGTHHMTIRNDVMHLIELGLVKEYPVKRGRRKQYIIDSYNSELTMNEHGTPIVVDRVKHKFQLPPPNGEQTAEELIKLLATTKGPIFRSRTTAGILALLVEKAHAEAEGEGLPVGEAFYETLSEEVHKIYEYHKTMVQLLSQIILAPLWDGQANGWIEREPEIRQLAKAYDLLQNGAITPAQYLETVEKTYA